MYMNTVGVGNLSGNVQIPHNCNTGQIHDCILLLFQILLLFRGILHEILLAADIVVEPSVAAGYSASTKCSAHLEHTVAIFGASPFDCTMTAAQTMAMMV